MRPATSKSRGVCRYYALPRGCFAGDKCKFIHADPLIHPDALTPYDSSKRCRFFANGFCKRGDACWFLHISDPNDALDDDDDLCSICFDKPSTYGLLAGCSHIFCSTCLKQWRDPLNKPGGVLDSSGNTKKCPMCRAPSKFITPSSRFWKQGSPEKASITNAYKESMARVPCRYFQKSLQNNKDKPICPYGKDCFYQHLKPDGTPYIFKDGTDVCLRKYKYRLQRGLYDEVHFMPFSLDLANLDIVMPNMIPPRIRFEMEVRADGSQNTRADVNGVAYAARRLHEVGRSLELFNDAMGDTSSSLDSLDVAVEALRAGLGRLEGANAESRLNRRAGAQDDPDATQEDDVMERLEHLADQMLASINALRQSGEEQEVARDTPPPPLEPTQDAETPPAPLIPAHDSDDDLPPLQSVSDTSDDGDDFSSDEESSDDGDISERLRILTAATNYGDIFAGWFSEVEPPERVQAPTEPQPESESDSEMPALESIQPTADDTALTSPPSDPPFVTDGRGRVVWTRPGEENKGETVVETAEPSEEEQREDTGSDSGSGGGILGWFNALF